MSDPSPSTRFRGVAIAVALSVAVLAPLLGFRGESLGLPFPDGSGASGRPLVGTAIDPQLLGASGVLPRDESLDPEVIAALDRPVRGTGANPPPVGPLPIPPIVLDSYRRAETVLAARLPGCGLRWSLLAGLGQVISEHANGGSPSQSGITRNPILGPRLDGSPGVASIPDTDDGRLDGDIQWDRAVGPMQIIPQVWHRLAADSDRGGTADPHSVYDASLVAGRHLCEHGSDLRWVQGQANAVFRYRRSEAFVQATILWSRAYLTRAELDATAGPTGTELAVLPRPSIVALPKVPPPAGPPRSLQSPVLRIPQPTPTIIGDGSGPGKPRSGPAPPPPSTAVPAGTKEPTPAPTTDPSPTPTASLIPTPTSGPTPIPTASPTPPAPAPELER